MPLQKPKASKAVQAVKAVKGAKSPGPFKIPKSAKPCVTCNAPTKKRCESSTHQCETFETVPISKVCKHKKECLCVVMESEESSCQTCKKSPKCSSSSSSSSEDLCCKIAKIIGFKKAETETKNCVCTISGERCLGKVTYLPQGKVIKSPLINGVSFTSEKQGCSFLNLGEISLHQSEVNPLIRELVKRKIDITALHNHWLLTKPVIMYLHITSTDEPTVFANKIHEAFKCTINPVTKTSILETLK
jgi:hypothetical protein